MKLGIIGSGMIVHDLLSFIEIIDEIELTAILGRKESKKKIETLVNISYQNELTFGAGHCMLKKVYQAEKFFRNEGMSC